MKFRTESGAVYEVDPNNRVRRVGPVGYTVRAAPEWRTAASVDVEVGRAAVIVWPTATPLMEGSPEDAVPLTVTSPVVEVWE